MFSYEDYKEIIRIIQSTGNQAGYEEALTADKFVIMRHDVEYSVDRAYALAKVESSMDFTSTFFFQWTNNSYNILSRRNQDLIKDMHERGHVIGLHYALNGLTDMQEVRHQIKKEMDILSEMFGFPITQFSVHRPSPDVRKHQAAGNPECIPGRVFHLCRKSDRPDAPEGKIYVRRQPYLALRLS